MAPSAPASRGAGLIPAERAGRWLVPRKRFRLSNRTPNRTMSGQSSPSHERPRREPMKASSATSECRVVAADELLDTPVIVVDEALLHRNIDEMASLAQSYGVSLRPHAKTHKSPRIARLQLEAGAIGLTCAKLG